LRLPAGDPLPEASAARPRRFDPGIPQLLLRREAPGLRGRCHVLAPSPRQSDPRLRRAGVRRGGTLSGAAARTALGGVALHAFGLLGPAPSGGEVPVPGSLHALSAAAAPTPAQLHPVR